MFEEKCCYNCKYSRLIYNKKDRDKFVGCIIHNGEEEYLLKSLDDANYSENEVRYGWIYANLLPDTNRKHHDLVDAGVLANLCLISPRHAKCNLFEKRFDY